MTSFQETYENAIHTQRLFTPHVETSDNYHFYSVSQNALTNLLYLQYSGETIVQHPFALSLNPLDSYLLLYTVNGTGHLSYMGESYSLSPNSIMFIQCCYPFSLNAHNSSNWHYGWTYINGPSIHNYYNMFHVKHSVSLVCRTNYIRDSFFKLIHTSVSDSLQDELNLSLRIHSLLTDILLEINNDNLIDTAPPYIKQIKNLFDTNYSKHYTLQQLSAEFQVSKYTLSKHFTKYVNQSPIEYLISIRIRHAMELLRYTDLPINQIASSVGFDNTTHFINLFKIRVGYTPSKYRKKEKCVT